MEFGKIKKIEQDWYFISLCTKGDKITITTDSSTRCCENHGVKFLSGQEFLKDSVRNILTCCVKESDDGVEYEEIEYEEIDDDEHGEEYDRYGSAQAVKYITIATSCGNKCIIKCYNSHNGYYSHTFSVMRGDDIIYSFEL